MVLTEELFLLAAKQTWYRDKAMEYCVREGEAKRKGMPIVQGGSDKRLKKQRLTDSCLGLKVKL